MGDGWQNQSEQCPSVLRNDRRDDPRQRGAGSLPFTWMFTSMDEVGENTSNPFEGGANDIPITRICDDIELDLKELLGETGPVPMHRPTNEIVM